MKLRNPHLIRGAAVLGAGLVQGWMATVRYRIENRDVAPHPAHPRHGRYLYAFWHEGLLVPMRFRVPTHVLISHHADGELIARICGHLGLGVVRGSTNRQGGRALLDMIAAAEETHLAITPDGPRGPRRQVQPGLVAMASHTGLPVVPLAIGFTKAWRARSWDRFAIPRPGSTVVVITGQAMSIPRALDRAGIETYRAEVERRMIDLTEEAEARARGRDLRGFASRRGHFRRVAEATRGS